VKELAENTVYQCHNKACPLGSLKDPGHFTAGITAAQRNVLYGDPVENMVEGVDFGEGICPTCGEKGTPTDIVHESLVGDDPYQALHDEVALQVQNESNTDVTTDNAQAKFESLVGDKA
jgi:hypothetical protein